MARLVTFFVLGMLLVLYRAPSMDVARRVYRGMVNLPAPWQDGFGPLGEAMRWLGVRFDGPPVSADQLVLVAWLIVWIAVVWFVPNTQQLLARWHPAFNYGMAERQRDLPLLARIRPIAPALEWRPDVASAVYVGVLAALAFLSLRHVSEFLYFKF